MRRRWIAFSSQALALGLLLLLTLQAGTAKKAALESLRLCGEVLLPALFPFSAATQLFLGTGASASLSGFLNRPLRLLALPSAAAGPLLAGFIGGYPVGIQALAAACQSGSLSREEGIRVCRICGQAGPGFLLGAVGLSLFGSKHVGWLLWLVQLLSALLLSLLFSNGSACEKQKPRLQRTPRMSLLHALPEAIRRSSAGMLTVCGCVVFFGTLSGLLRPLVSALPEPIPALLSAFLELGGGILRLTSVPRRQGFVLCAVLVCFGGCSVHAQSAAILRSAGLPYLPYLHAKLLQTMAAGLIALLLTPFL